MILLNSLRLLTLCSVPSTKSRIVWLPAMLPPSPLKRKRIYPGEPKGFFSKIAWHFYRKRKKLAHRWVNKRFTAFASAKEFGGLREFFLRRDTYFRKVFPHSLSRKDTDYYDKAKPRFHILDRIARDAEVYPCDAPQRKFDAQLKFLMMSALDQLGRH